MFNHIIRISFLFSILILVSCSGSENSETQTPQTGEESNPSGFIPEETIPYPAIFSDSEVPLIDGAYLINVKQLKNTKHMAGMQIAEKTDKSFEEVKAYYLETLESTGWERRTDADKQSTTDQERDEAPIKYFVTKFHKDLTAEEKKYVLLINITTPNDGITTVTKIIKEM